MISSKDKLNLSDVVILMVSAGLALKNQRNVAYSDCIEETELLMNVEQNK